MNLESVSPAPPAMKYSEGAKIYTQCVRVFMRHNTILPSGPSLAVSSLSSEPDDRRDFNIVRHVRRLAADTYLLDTDLGCPILLDPASD